ncbi:transposase [Streptomyces phaeochromogenes]|uniref:transposase n=1 Tax=Streptomyces phaeochromogenes TaxID=1923 RepID=UPI0036AA8C85
MLPLIDSYCYGVVVRGVGPGRLLQALVDGHREILGIDVATTEDGADWLGFLRSLIARGRIGQYRRMPQGEPLVPNTRSRDAGQGTADPDRGTLGRTPGRNTAKTGATEEGAAEKARRRPARRGTGNAGRGCWRS